MLLKGETLFNEGRIDEAEGIFRSILEKDSGHREALNNVGVMAYQRGDGEKAVTFLVRALEADPFYREALFNLADVLKAAGRLSEITPFLNAFQERDPGDEAIAGLLAEADEAAWEKLPLVSVHMVVWNGEKYIAQAIESVLGQTYRNFELVIVDDGSTDRTRQIVEGFASKKIKYFYKEHSGVAPTRNVARRHCHGDYIAFLDADDLYEPRMLEIEVKTLLENPDIDVVYTNLNIIDEKGEKTGVACDYGGCSVDGIIPDLFHEGHNTVPFGSMMLRKEISDRVGPFDEDFSLSEDSDYIMRLAMAGRFKHIPDAFYRCRRHGANLSHELTGRKTRARGTFLLLRKMLSLVPRENLCPGIAWRELPPEKAEAEFHFQAAQTFWNNCQGYFYSGGYNDFLEEAGDHIQRCLAADPGHREGKILAGKIGFIAGLGKMKQAEDFTAGEKGPSGEICRGIIEAGWDFVGKRRLEEGETSFSLIMDMKWLPMQFGMEALLGMGKTHWLRGDTDRAKDYYSKALTLLNTFEHNTCLSNLHFLEAPAEADEAAWEKLPLVSVHMVVWNGEKYIAQAIESVLGQTYRNFELVIVDDGSTDRTREIVEGFASKKIKYFYKEHSGVAPTRNVARRHCHGDYIAFLDADDLYEPRMLEIEVKTLLENPDIDVVYTNLNIIDEKGREKKEIWQYRDYEPGELVAALFRQGQNVTSSGSMMFTKKISDLVGDFDEDFKVSFDSDFIARLARYGRFKHIDLPLYRYRRHEANVTHAERSLKERARAIVLLSRKMLSLFSREQLCPGIAWQELPPEKAEAEFHFYVGSILWNHCRNYLRSGHHGDLLWEAETHIGKCLAAVPNHRGGSALMKNIRLLSRPDGGQPQKSKPAAGKKKASPGRRPLTVLFLADCRSQHTKRYVRFFRDRGHAVHLFDTNVDGKDLDGIFLHTPQVSDPRMPGLKTKDPFLRTVFDLHRVIREVRPDILHGHYLQGWCWWGGFSGFQPFVTTAWGSDIYLDPNRPFIKRLTSFCLQESRLVTADSRDLLEATAALRGFREGLQYVPFGIDTDFFRPGQDTRTLAERLGIQASPGLRVVLSPRQFKPEANIHVLIQAAPKILQRFPETVFILKTYLTGDSAAEPYRRYLYRLVEENRLADRVLFLNDLPFSDMPLLYNLADVMVTLRDTDGSSCSMLEAMACRTPVVASDIESMREWIGDGRNGRLVDHHNPEAVAAAVTEILADGGVRERFAEAGYDLVREKADYRANWAEVEEGYYQLLADPRSGVGGSSALDPCADVLRTGWRLTEAGDIEKGEASFSMILSLRDLPMQDHLKALLGLGKIAWMRGDWERMEGHYVNALKLLYNFELATPLTFKGQELHREMAV